MNCGVREELLERRACPVLPRGRSRIQICAIPRRAKKSAADETHRAFVGLPM